MERRRRLVVSLALQEVTDALAEIEGNASVSGSRSPGADPDEFAGRGQRIQHVGAEAGDPGRQDHIVEQTPRQRQALQLRYGLAQPSQALLRCLDAVPARKKEGERRAIDGCNLVAEPGQVAALESAQHICVAPIRLGAARAYLPAHELTAHCERLEYGQHLRSSQAKAQGYVIGQERAAMAREALQQQFECILDRLEECIRYAARWHDAQRVPVKRGVGGSDEALVTGNRYLDGAPGRDEFVEPGQRVVAGTRRQFVFAEIADTPQHVMQVVGIACAVVLRAELQVVFELLEYTGIDQVAEFGLTEQFRQQAAIQRQRLGLAFGERRVLLVQVRSDVGKD